MSENMGYERKSFPFILEEKGIDEEERTFKGYFAVFGNFDGWDVIDFGACKKTLTEQGDRVRIFWIHDFRNPIGCPIEIKEIPRAKLPPELLKKVPNATGALWVHGRIDEIPEGDRALTQMKSGTLSEGSIGFKAIKTYYEEMPDGESRRHIKELLLRDISPVPIAMNEGTMIVDVKTEEIDGHEVKVEVSDDFITVPVPKEAGKHSGKGHRIRYINIDKKKGIRAKFCGVHKVIISYVFTKAKTWTVAKAVKWVKEHTKKKEETPEMLVLKAVFEQVGEIEDSIVLSVDGYVGEGVLTLADLKETMGKVEKVVAELQALEEEPVPDAMTSLLLNAEMQRAKIQEAMLVAIQVQAEPS